MAVSTLPFRLGELLDVHIEKLSFGGNGIAKVEGAVVFVPFSAPGDHLQIKIVELKKRHAEGEIVTILKPSAERVLPPCPVFGICGGCNWQHLSYETQLEHKQKIVTEFLQKLADAQTKFFPIIPSPKAFHYRNRAQLKYQNKKLGFFKKNSHDIADTNVCWIIEEPLSDRLPKLRAELSAANLPGLQEIHLSLQKDGHVAEEMSREIPEGEGFSQVNRFQNEHLMRALLERLKNDSSPADIYDLYAGSGNFTFPVIESLPHRRVVGVELHPGAARKAQALLKSLGRSPKKAEFYCSDVGLFLRRFPVAPESTIILDPPRAGCAEEVISALAALLPRKILYISCDPASLARDLDLLAKKSRQKFSIAQVQCFEMFPQTHHVETFVELTRNPS